MSKRIEQIIELIAIVKQRWTGGGDICSLRTEATQIVAKDYGVSYQTVCDGYTRRLGLRAKDFDRLLLQWLKNGDSGLRDLLAMHSDASDEALMSSLFGVSQKDSGVHEAKRDHFESEDAEIVDIVMAEIAPEGPKKFPKDFLDDSCQEFYEKELPGTPLHLAPLTQTIITSPRGYFRYEAKTPPEAKYILYAHEKGLRKIKIPKDNLTLFKAVKAYEKYCDDLRRRAFELLLEFTYDENKAEILTERIANALQLRYKRSQL